MRFQKGDILDDVIFGDSESDQKTPWSLTWYLLSPGSLFIYYLTFFFDTNPLLVVLLILSYLGSDVSFWLELAACFDSRTRTFAVRGFVVRALLAATYAAVIYALYAFLPLAINQTAFHWIVDALFYLYVGIGWVDALRVLSVRIPSMRVLARTWCVKRRRDPALVKAVIAALDQADRSGYFSPKPWRDLYTITGGGGANQTGAFGKVLFGVAKDTGEAVAIKFYRIQKRQTLTVALSKAVWAALPFQAWRPGEREVAIQKLAETAAERMRLMDKKHIVNARYEARVLTAIRALGHPSLLRMLSAHRTVNEAGEEELAIVTQQAGADLCTAVASLPLDTRMKIVQRVCDAVGRLHAGGIIHRDLKPENVCISLSDVSVPVLIDFGIARCPTGEDPHACLSTVYFSAPEICKSLTGGDEHLQKLAAANVTESADVWSLGLTAAQVLFGSDPLRVKLIACGVVDPLNENAPVDNHRVQEVLAAWSLADTDIGLQRCIEEAGFGDAAQGVVRMLSQMLHPDPDQRITAADAATHPCFDHLGPPSHWAPQQQEQQRAVLQPEGFQHPPPLQEHAATIPLARAQTVDTNVDVTGNGLGPGAPSPHRAFRGPQIGAAGGFGLRLDRRAPEGNLALIRSTCVDAAAIVEQMRPDLASADVPARDSSQIASLVRSIHAAFTRHSHPSSSTLSLEGLKAVLRDLGLEGDQYDPTALFFLYDEDRNEAIDRRELLCGLAYLLVGRADAPTLLSLTFEAYANEEGVVTPSEFAALLMAYGFENTPTAFADLFRRLAVRDSSHISKDDFLGGIARNADLGALFLQGTAQPFMRLRTSSSGGDSTALADSSPRPTFSGVPTAGFAMARQRTAEPSASDGPMGGLVLTGDGPMGALLPGAPSTGAGALPVGSVSAAQNPAASEAAEAAGGFVASTAQPMGMGVPLRRRRSYD